MIVNLLAGVQFGVAFAVLTLTQATHAEDFLWQHGRTRIGRLAVPAGFKVQNYDYREGIVTTLVYQDGSRITPDFDRALDSFIREIAGRPAPGR